MAQVDFSPIGDLANIWKNSRQEAALSDLGQGLANGTLDYKSAAGQAAKAGKLELSLALLKMGQQRDSAESFNKMIPALSSIYGGGGVSPDAPSTPAAPLGQVMPNRVYSQDEVNPIDAKILTPQQLASGVNAPPQYAPIIGKAAIDNDLSPNLLTAQIRQESGFNPKAVSSAGATGISQFMPGTARQMGIDPSDPSQAIPAQAQYLRQNVDRFGGSVANGLAAYNWGPENVQKWLAQGGDPSKLPAETQNYIRSIAGQGRTAAQPSGAPLPIMAPNQATKAIPLLMAAMGNEGLPQAQRDTAKVLLEHALKSSDLPEAQKNYVLYRAQGGTDDFTKWDRGNRTAGATMINTTEGMDAAQIKARIDVDKAAIAEHAKKTIAGRAALPILDQIVSIANKTPGGWAGAVSPTIAKALAGVGIPVPEGISNAELMISLNRQLVPGVRDPGSASNLEQNMYMQALPGLSQSPEGRLKIAGMMRSMIERNAEIMRVYRANLGSPDLDKKLAEIDNKPIFAPEERKVLERFAGAGGAGTAQAATAPPSKAIEALKANPSLREQFEAKYGPGSSAGVLGQ